jgi:ferritin-like metal-binding protein YciE
MAKKASDKTLAAAFTAHLKESEGQVGRVEQAFKSTGKAAKSKKCEAMTSLNVDPRILIPRAR